MARLFELSTHVQAIGRSDGRSATAAAAYRACCVIECEREGKTHDYRRKGGLEATEIVVPPGAVKDRGKLWNGAELAERNGKRGKNAGQFKADARTAREAFYSFPAELSQAGRLNVARIIAAHVVEAHRVGAEFSIHQPGKDGDNRNYHCHMLMTTRRLTAKGFSEKAREWDDQKTGPKLTRDLRAFIAKTLNAELAAEGKAALVHVEHLSFKDRGIVQKATVHQGPGKSAIERKQRGQARRAWFQKMQRDQVERQGKELAGLKLRQDFGIQAKQADLARRESEGGAAIRRELDRQRTEDRAPDGMSRVFLTVTGKAGREAFDRQARETQRVADAGEKLAVLKQELQTERTAYITAQTRERAALIERHGGEDQQLQQALRSRESLDRSAEVVQRREQVQDQIQERDRHQQQDRTGPPRAPGLSLH